jgi:hypothetical protein
MNRPVMRSAMGCAIACGAMVVGPAIAGAAVAKADLLGIGGGGGGIDVLGIDVLGSGGSTTTKSGSSAPTTSRVTRPTAVSTAPSARSVVIRGKLPAVQADPKIVPAASLVPAAEAPAVALGAPLVEVVPAAPAPVAPRMRVVVPLAVPPPLPAAPPVRSPAPDAVPVPATIEPGPGSQIAPADSYPPPTKIPDSFRVGYGEYLRAATTTDLFAAAVPGVVGIAGFTLLGMYAGYRQARAVQAALLPAVPTQFVL